MKEITTNGKTIIFVEVEKGATYFHVLPNKGLFVNGNDIEAGVVEYLPSGNWKILGKSTESIHELLGISKESYLSLLEANGIVDRFSISEPPENIGSNISEWEKEYQKEKSKVKHYLVLKRI